MPVRANMNSCDLVLFFVLFGSIFQELQTVSSVPRLNASEFQASVRNASHLTPVSLFMILISSLIF